MCLGKRLFHFDFYTNLFTQTPRLFLLPLIWQNAYRLTIRYSPSAFIIPVTQQ